MPKHFFKEFITIRDALEKDKENKVFNIYTAYNYTCFEAVKKYLYSYKWCRSDRERILLQTADSYKKGEDIAREYGIQYNSYRSMSSRVSNRMYRELGNNFKDIVLGNNKKEQDKLIDYCVVRMDDFRIENVYPEFLVSKMEEISKKQDVNIDEEFKIRRTDFIILKFLASCNIEAILKQVSLLDKNRVSTFYTILTDSRYFKQRAEVLSVIRYFQKNITISSMQAETDFASKDRGLISRKEYEEYLRYKQNNSI